LARSASAGTGTALLPKASAPWSRTTTTSSHTAGTKAPLSAAGPCTLAICAMPSRDMRSWLYRIEPNWPSSANTAGWPPTFAQELAPARLHHRQAGQAVHPGEAQRPHMLLAGDGVVGAVMHRGVVGDHHAGPARHHAHAGHDAGARRDVAVQAFAGQLAQLKEGRASVEQRADALAHQQLARFAQRGTGTLPLPAATAAARRERRSATRLS
jgi:hypothetical protein